MNDYVFVLDASALSRKFYDDIGKRNLDKIYSIPDSVYIIPEICLIETSSALLKSCNLNKITFQEYKLAMSVLYNMIEKGEIQVSSFKKDYVKNSISILEKYLIQPKKSFNGMDSVYIALCNEIVKDLTGTDTKVIFVTSDNKLYFASKDEPLYETFHFWTCDFGCGHETFIPFKGKSDRDEDTRKCSKCGNLITVAPVYRSPNTCSICGNHCKNCESNLCPSTYNLNLN